MRKEKREAAEEKETCRSLLHSNYHDGDVSLQALNYFKHQPRRQPLPEQRQHLPEQRRHLPEQQRRHLPEQRRHKAKALAVTDFE